MSTLADADKAEAATVPAAWKPSPTWALWVAGLGAYLTTHLLWIGQVAGFHFDEAWAAWLSHRIATERGFWPLQAMSPYTSAWSHYIAAVLFSALGTSLRVYRLGGVLLAAGGMSGMSLALRRIGETRSAAILPWILAFFPAAVINERFCVEITTFQVFCFGMLCLGLAESREARAPARRLAADLTISVAALLGITSHVLFIAPALGAWLAFRPREAGPPRRLVFFTTLGVLFAFFLRIHAQIPEKGKSLALVVATAALMLECVAPASVSRRLSRAGENLPGREAAIRAFRLGLAALSVPAFFFLLFFAEGSWSTLFFTATLPAPWLVGSVAVPPLIALALAWRRGFPKPRPGATRALRWFQLTVVITAVISVKPAPRYFEVPLLMTGALLSLVISRLSRLEAAFCLAAWGLTGSLQLGFNYLEPGLDRLVPERNYRFALFRDGTSDTLQKQRLALELARSGCRFSQVASNDERLLLPLRFLSLGDWVIPASAPPVCRYGEGVRVSRKSESLLQSLPSSGDAAVREFGPFLISGTDQRKP